MILDHVPAASTGPPAIDGTDPLPNDQYGTPELAKAEERFREDLHRLLTQSEKLGTWVLYSAQGLVAEGPDEMHFFRKFGKLIGTRYYLARIQPDPPAVVDITPNWFVRVVRDTADSNSTCGR